MENDARISYPEREQARTKFNYEFKFRMLLNFFVVKKLCSYRFARPFGL